MHKLQPSRNAVATFAFLLAASACSVSTHSKPTEQPTSEPTSANDSQAASPATATPVPTPAKQADAAPKAAEAKPKPKAKPSTEPAKAPSPAPAAAPKSEAKIAAGEPTQERARVKAPAKPEPSQLVVPVRVAFASAVAKIDALVEKTAKQNWTRVSKAGDSPEVEVKYTLWREPIKASFDDQTLHVTVPVHYAATVRAKVKNPLTGKDLWLTQGETWGTKAEPQEIKATFHAKLSVGDDLSLKADAKLDALEHGKAPSGDVCVKAIAKVCVAKSSMASQVRSHLNDYLTPRIKKSLADADKKVEEALNLKAHAQQLWTALQEPRSLESVLSAACPPKSDAACKTSAWLVIKPTALGLAQPRMDGKDLRADLSITGDFAVVVGDKPAVTPAPLPKLSPVSGAEGLRLSATMRMPLAVLGPDVAKALKGLKFGDSSAKQLEIKSVKLADGSDEGHPHRMTLSLTVRGALKADLALHGDLVYDAKAQELSIENLAYDAATQALAEKELLGLDHAALRKQLADKARLKLAPSLAGMNKAVRTALEQAASGELKIAGELSQVDVQDFKVGPHAVVASVLLAGQLAVTYSPK